MAAEEVQKTLIDYLAEGIKPQPPQAVVVVAEADAPVPPVIAPIVDTIAQCDGAMFDLLAHVKRIGMCAKDLHYRAKGKPFYGLHELADLVWQIERESDQVIEIYYMGTRGIEPPRMTEVFAAAVGVAVLYPKNDNYFIGGLMSICRTTMLLIENIKKEYSNLPAGMHAVLDNISQQCLLSIGLLDQTLK